jgi:hypothetical protein
MPRRRLPLRAYMLVSLAGILAFVLGAGLLVRRALPPEPSGGGRILAMTAVSAVAVGWLLWVAITCFRRMDEFRQAAAKFAWYWGGSVGVGLSTILYAFIGIGGLHWLDPADFHLGRDLFEAYVLGYMTAVLPILAGFLGARIWWRITKR